MARKKLFSNPAILALLALLLGACGLPRQRFVDEDGKPLPGVLVMSVRPGAKALFLSFLSPACSSAYFTDADGWAPVASRGNARAFLAGHHVWTGDRVLDHGRSTMRQDGDLAVMHPRSAGDPPRIRESLVTLKFAAPADEVQLVPTPPELGVTIQLVDRKLVRARSEHGELLPSSRFFFAGPATGRWVSDIEQEYDLFFYVRVPSGRYFKVGVIRLEGSGSIRVESDGLKRHVPAVSVRLVWTELGELATRIEPPPRPELVIRLGEVHVADPAAVAVALQAAMDRGDVEKTEESMEYLDWLQARARELSSVEKS